MSNILNNPNGKEANGQVTITDRVNLLTYNFLIRPPGVTNNGNDYKDKRIDLFCNSILSFYDIVCMQEVFAYGSYRRSRLIELAKQSGLPFSRASTIPCFITGTDGGLVMLSRYPMVRTNELTFSQAALSDKFAYKGCIYAKIAIRENFHFHVFTTHTQFSRDIDPPLSDETVQIRLKQFAEIRQFMDENLVTRPPEEPVFFMGDLNVNGRVTKFENDNRSSAEYLAMYQILCEGSNSQTSEKPSKSINFKDLLFDKHGYHPITFGDYIEVTDNKHEPKDKVLTLKSDQLSCLSLDYIFMMDDDNSNHSMTNNPPEFKAEIANVQVEEMLNEKPTQDFPCTQLSDHYGVSAQVLVKRVIK